MKNFDNIPAMGTAAVLVLEMGELTTEEIETLGDLSKLSPLDIKRIVNEKRLSKLGLNGNAFIVFSYQYFHLVYLDF